MSGQLRAVTEGVALTLETREVGALGKEAGIGPFQVFKRLLQRVAGRIGQPRRFGAIAPFG